MTARLAATLSVQHNAGCAEPCAREPSAGAVLEIEGVWESFEMDSGADHNDNDSESLLSFLWWEPSERVGQNLPNS
jgi:hypothetical protein